MVEIEIGVLRSQCLDRRITWMFTTERAREKMGNAYPDPKPALPQAA